MVKKSTIKRYENLIRDLTADQIQAIVEAENAEEVKEVMNKPNIADTTAVAYKALIKKYYRSATMETPTRYETRLANVNPQLTEEVRLMNTEMQRLREENERQSQIIEEMQRQMREMQEEIQRLRQAQQARRQTETEEANELERAWLDQQEYESPNEPQEPETELELDELELDIEVPLPKIERYVRKGERIIRVDQTTVTGYDLSYFKDFGNVEGSRLKVKMDIRIPEENKTISVYKDLGKVESVTQAKDLVEAEIDYQGGKYSGVVIGTRIYIVS